jgi:hypothetical protein
MHGMSRTKACRAHNRRTAALSGSATLLPLVAVSQSPYSGRAKNDKRYRHHHPTSQALSPACRYLSLKFQTIQSCSPVRGPIATAVQPWLTQECAYTLLKSQKPAARCIAGLRFSVSPAAARYGFQDPVFHRICIKARPMETPLCKISFLILTPGALKTDCALHFRPPKPAIPSVQQRLSSQISPRYVFPDPHQQRFDRRLSIIYSK